jgi:outer membrane protein insertion porin family
VNEQLIFNQIRSSRGQPYREAVAKEDVRRLFRIGQFRTLDAVVEPNPDGSVDLIFRVEEAPIVQDVQVVGNRSIPDKDIADVVRIDPGVPIDEYELGRAERAIEELYRKRGFFLVDVTVDREELERDNVVLFIIREGGRISVTDIRFEGNNSFPPRELRTEITTKVRGIFNRGPLDNETLDADVSALVRFYRDRGYLDVRADRRITPSPNGREAIVTYLIEEGPLYSLRTLIMVTPDLAEGQSPSISKEQAIGLMSVKPGDVYSLRDIQTSIVSIREAYWQLGHPDADVNAQELRVPGDRPEVDLLLTVREGPRLLVGEVIIQGNSITKQRVIRRQLQQADIRPERPLNQGALDRAERRLNSLRLFDPAEPARVVVQRAEDDSLNYRDVLTEVAETDTGSVTFLAAVGSDSGLIGSISIGQRNFDIARTPESLDELLSNQAFRGAGQEFNLTLAPGTEIQTYSISLTEPSLLDKPISLGGTIFLRDRVYDQYDEGRYGFRARLGRRFGDLWTAGLVARVESVELTDIDADAPVDFFEAAGPSLLIGLGLNLTRTTVPFEERFVPTRGTRLEANIEQVGGDYSFTRIEAKHTVWVPVMEDYLGRRTVLSMNTRIGYIPQTGEAPTYERYYMGGRDFRGFEFRTISPRSVQRDGQPSNDPVGGDWLFFWGLELEQPIWQNILSGVIFMDSGTVVNDPGFEDYRVSVGFGIRLRIAALSNAPLAFDFGFPIKTVEGDEESLFSFSIDVPF